MDGDHEVDSLCWECGKPTESNDCCCGRCELAVYCSYECQSKAWKGGHKEKCARLQSLFQACEESFKTIESLYEGKGIGDSIPVYHGIQLDHVTDCLAAWAFHSYSAINAFPEFLGPPSMDTFYENLGKVNRGEWWIWPLSDTGSLLCTRQKLLS